MEQKRFIVTLKSHEDLENFYKDMEVENKKSNVPQRKVECARRRPISRNTEYLLSEVEAAELRNDPRVLAVERIPEEIGIVPIRMFTQTETTWNKSSTNNVSHKNWGLLRSVLGEQIANWGSNATASQSGTITVNAEGRNVDVVVVDGMINPLHPEYAVNANGTGGSRVIQYNWFQHSLGQVSDTYVYEPYDNGLTDLTDDNNHGAHVAGTIAGSTQGWARSANIYNINPYATDVNSTSTTLLIDYIRAFHANKPINPLTGRRNPTICNHSWGYGSALSINNITSVTVKGATTNGPFTTGQLNDFGIRTATLSGVPSALVPARVTAVDADMEDAIADGIIMVGAAGNDNTRMDVLGGEDFDNSIVWNGFTVRYHRGMTPAAAGNTICVGAVSALSNETKATFSNCGPRVDIYAPGQNIISSFNSTTSFGGVNDPRDSAYRIGKISGTSMASPQVCGVLACALEIYPNMTQDEAIEYLQYYAKKDQMTDTGGGFTDLTSLQGSQNNYLFYFEERLSDGSIFPKQNNKVRPQAGAVYPRPTVRRKG
jgi:subtilisin family serine protease